MVKCVVCLQETDISSNDKKRWLGLFKKNSFMYRLSMMLFKQRQYSLYWCKRCDLIFCFPMKNPGADWYRNKCVYYKINKILTPVMDISWPQRLFLDEKIYLGGTLLDVGCGTGSFLKEAQKKGYHVSGIDFDQSSIQIAKEISGIEDVHALTLEQYTNIFNKKFKIVTFFEVLEHIDNLPDFIHQVRQIVEPGGYIALSVPNRERDINTLTEMDLPPNHLVQWNVSALKNFLEKEGFTLIKVDKKLKVEDVARYISIKTSLGIVKRGVELVESSNYVLHSLVNRLQFYSAIKSKVVYILVKFLYLAFKIFFSESSNIYILAKLERK